MPICTDDCIFNGHCYVDGNCTGFDSKPEMLLSFSKYIHEHWLLQKYWDSDPCERSNNPKKLMVSSPPDPTISGISSTLTDLYYAAEREQRQRDTHQNEQISQIARNIGDIASAQALLNNPNIRPGVKAYLQNLILGLLAKQESLARKMGLQSTDINEIA